MQRAANNSDVTATKALGIYSLVVGVSMIGMWVMILISQQIPGGVVELSFHLTSEFLTALLCIAGSTMLLMRKPTARTVNMLAMGMVLYSVLNAAGYYGERGETPMLAMFLVLTALSSASLIIGYGLFRKTSS